MKKLTYLILALSFPMLAFASGSTIGNGGNGVLCNKGMPNQTIEVLDYYELRLNGGSIQLNSSIGNYLVILNELFNRWQIVAPKRMDLYRKWLKDFSQEAGFVPGVNIPSINDTGIVTLAANCELTGLAFQRSDDEVYPGSNRYIINKDLWVLLPEEQKAGLVLHELIYREAIHLAHRTSYPTRYFNGYLSSAIPKAETYSAVVSALPLGWVEYGAGVILNLQKGAKVSSSGDVEGAVSEIFSKIVSDRINAELVDLEPHDSGYILVTDYEFAFSKRTFSVNNLGLRFISAEINITTPFKNISSVNMKTKCTLELSGSGINLMELEVDPKTSWFRQPNGSLIQNIKTIGKSSSFSGTFGDIIKTENGEVWHSDFKKCIYTRQ